MNVDIRAYLLANTPPEIENVMIRTVDSLMHGGILTMSQLCDVSLDVLIEIPNMNYEAAELILLLCEKYMAEHGGDAKGCDSS